MRSIRLSVESVWAFNALLLRLCTTRCRTARARRGGPRLARRAHLAAEARRAAGVPVSARRMSRTSRASCRASSSLRVTARSRGRGGRLAVSRWRLGLGTPPAAEIHPVARVEVILIDLPVVVEAEQVVLRRTDLDQLRHGLLPVIRTPSVAYSRERPPDTPDPSHRRHPSRRAERPATA